jgi:asparagine synthase (glutamine-hydrolysing)
VVEEYVLSERAQARGIFNADYVRELVNRHEAGEDHAERLWMLINLEIWQRTFFDREVVQEPANAMACAVSASAD